MGEIKTYTVILNHEYIIKTDDIQRTMNQYEYPIFTDLSDDDAAEFVQGTTTWEEGSQWV